MDFSQSMWDHKPFNEGTPVQIHTLAKEIQNYINDGSLRINLKWKTSASALLQFLGLQTGLKSLRSKSFPSVRQLIKT